MEGVMVEINHAGDPWEPLQDPHCENHWSRQLLTGLLTPHERSKDQLAHDLRLHYDSPPMSATFRLNHVEEAVHFQCGCRKHRHVRQKEAKHVL